MLADVEADALQRAVGPPFRGRLPVTLQLIMSAAWPAREPGRICEEPSAMVFQNIRSHARNRLPYNSHLAHVSHPAVEDA